MQSTLRMHTKRLFYAAILALIPTLGFANEFSCSAGSQKALSVSKSGRQTATYCFAGRRIELQYDNTRRIIAVSKDGKKTTISKIDKGYTPDLIGMTAYIRFLPAELQPYSDHGVVLINTIERSTGGEGGGQCGSGYELYLNALKVSQSRVKPVGRVKIGSCLESTTLYDMEDGPDDFSSFSVREGKLAIKFLLLKGEIETPTAVLSDDFRDLKVIPD